MRQRWQQQQDHNGLDAGEMPMNWKMTTAQKNSVKLARMHLRIENWNGSWTRKQSVESHGYGLRQQSRMSRWHESSFYSSGCSGWCGSADVWSIRLNAKIFCGTQRMSIHVAFLRCGYEYGVSDVPNGGRPCHTSYICTASTLGLCVLLLLLQIS